MKKIIMCVFLLMFSCAIVSAVTIEDVIESYGFNVTEDDYIVLSYNDSMFDFEVLNLELVGEGEPVDSIFLNLEVDAPSSGVYDFRYVISGEYSEENLVGVYSLSLSSGVNNVEIPLELDYFRDESLFSLDLNVYENETLAYSGFDKILVLNLSSEFVAKELPDLVVSDLEYSNFSGELNFTIANVGEKDAFGFVYSVYDDNFSVAAEDLIVMLLNGEDVSFSLNLSSNLSSVFVLVDGYEFVEESDESNNFAFWPEVEENDSSDNLSDVWSVEVVGSNETFFLNETEFDLNWKKDLIFNVSKDRVELNFSREIYFDEGEYIFEVGSDDGSRLYVDDELVIDNWRDQSYKVKYSDVVFLSEGEHEFRVDYYEKKGNARVSFGFEKAVSKDFEFGEDEWASVWYDTKTQRVLSSESVSEDLSFDLEWGKSEVFDLQKDYVGMISKRRVFLNGSYILGVGSDDGSRVYVDDELVIDNWRDQNFKVKYSEVLNFSGFHNLTIEYYEKKRNSRVYFEVFDTCPEEVSVGNDSWNFVYCDMKTSRVLGYGSEEKFVFDYDWKKGEVFDLQKDSVLVKAARSIDFVNGSYEFIVGSDDGVRVWLDSEVLFDDWKDRSFKTDSEVLELSGEHNLSLEYYEKRGNARLYFDIVASEFSGKVKPILECVEWHNNSIYDNVTNTTNYSMSYTAHFGYLSENPFSVRVLEGKDNKLSPAIGKVIELFAPGRSSYYPDSAFSVDFNGSNLVWSLLGRTSTASSNPQQRCEE